MSQILRYSQKDVEIIKQETAYKGHFELRKMHFRYKRYSGEMSSEVEREVFVKGAASVLIAYDQQRDNVVLIEQVRIGAYQENGNGSPWLLELVAGMIDKENETAEEVAIREAQEEAGLEITHIEHALSAWDSPGGTVERLHLFLGLVDSSKVKAGLICGLEEENEDILVHVVSRSQAYQWVEEGKIDNVMTVLGLQWLQLHYQKYQK